MAEEFVAAIEARGVSAEEPFHARDEIGLGSRRRADNDGPFHFRRRRAVIQSARLPRASNARGSGQDTRIRPGPMIPDLALPRFGGAFSDRNHVPVPLDCPSRSSGLAGSANTICIDTDETTS